MKFILILSVTFSIALAGFSQSLNNVAGSAFVEGYDIKGRPFTGKANENIEGTPKLNENWATGEVRLSNNFLLKNVQLQFDLYENEVYFMKDNIVYTFADPVKEFTFSYGDGSDEKRVLFRKGYPDFQNHNDNTFYQVLSDGDKVQLLKFIYKRIEEPDTYGSPGKKQYATEQELYVYDVQQKKLSRIKGDKTSVLKALPAYAASLEKYLPQTKKISEDQLVQAIEKINNPS